MENVLIEDNFLTKREIEGLQETIINPNFPWRFNKWILYPGLKEKIYSFPNIKEHNGFQLVHHARGMSMASTEYAPMLGTVFDKFCDKVGIEYETLLRVKVNLTTKDNEHDRCAPHIDHMFPHKSFIYYVNDSDGDTVLYNEKFEKRGEVRNLSEYTRIHPQAGRAITFDGLTYHTPLSPVKNDFRIVLNITYI